MNVLPKTLLKTPKSKLFSFSLSSKHSSWCNKLLHNNYDAELQQDVEIQQVAELQQVDPATEERPKKITTSIDQIERKNLKKPSEIPYQRKVANWINFVGTVTKPIEFRTSFDGKSWASTVVCQHRSPFFVSQITGIPVIFEGDLAHTVATHLKQNEIVYVAGHLSSKSLPIKLTNDHENLKVMAHDVYFVRESPRNMVILPRSKPSS